MDEIEYLPGTTIPRDPVIDAYKKDVDVTLIRQNLKRSVGERLRLAQELYDTVIALRSAGNRMREAKRGL